MPNTREKRKQENNHYKEDLNECKKGKSDASKNGKPDGNLKLKNTNIEKMESDILYHLALGTATHDLVEMFGDVKFVCMGGTAERMKKLANYIIKEIDYKLPVGTTLENLTEKSQRFSMYKVGPVLCVNHGMGVPSLGILLHEMIKLMYHAKIKDPTFFRIGTCGGIGLKPGTVVVSDGAVDELGNHYYEQKICGEVVTRPAVLDQNLVKELLALKDKNDQFEVVSGITLCSNDFYEGQGRTDGAFCEHSEEEKMKYLAELQKKGVKNIEMESTVFAAFTHKAGIKAAIVDVTLVNRLKEDQVSPPKETLLEWQNYPQVIVGRYIKKKLSES